MGKTTYTTTKYSTTILVKTKQGLTTKGTAIQVF